MKTSPTELVEYRNYLETLIGSVSTTFCNGEKAKDTKKPKTFPILTTTSSIVGGKKEKKVPTRIKTKVRKESQSLVSPLVVDAKRGKTLQAKEEGETTIHFNKLAFAKEEGLKERKSKVSKKLCLPKDPKQAMIVMEKRKAVSNQISESDPSKGGELEEKNSWAKAIYKAKGVAIRDDARLLKKALTKKKAQKSRGKLFWEEKQQKVVEEMQAKQTKRRDNLQARRDANKKRKLERRK